MSASYPSGAKTFTTRTNGQSIDASHIDDLQDEVRAIEVDLVAGLPVARGGTGLAAVTSGGVLYGASASTVASSALLTANDLVKGGGAGVAPASLGVQNANKFVAGPVSGSDAIVAVRALDPLDLGALRTTVTSQFDKTTNTTLADVTGLTFTLVAGKTYHLRAVLMLTQDTTGGVKLGIGGTVTATTFAAQAVVHAHNVASLTSRATSLGAIGGYVSGVAASIAYIDVYIVVNAGGTITVQFAQSVSNGTSSVLVGSSFRAY